MIETHIIGIEQPPKRSYPYIGENRTTNPDILDFAVLFYRKNPEQPEVTEGVVIYADPISCKYKIGDWGDDWVEDYFTHSTREWSLKNA